MAEATIKIQKKVEEQVNIPIPSYWKKRKITESITEVFAVVSPVQVINVWVYRDEKKPSATISVRDISQVSEFGTDEVSQVERIDFDAAFEEAGAIQAILLSFR